MFMTPIRSRRLQGEHKGELGGLGLTEPPFFCARDVTKCTQMKIKCVLEVQRISLGRKVHGYELGLGRPYIIRLASAAVKQWPSTAP